MRAATTKFEKSEKDRGDKILQEMEEAVVDNTGNFLTRLFKILRRVNARKEVDVEAVRDVLQFLRPSRPDREHMNVADEL